MKRQNFVDPEAVSRCCTLPLLTASITAKPAMGRGADMKAAFSVFTPEASFAHTALARLLPKRLHEPLPSLTGASGQLPSRLLRLSCKGRRDRGRSRPCPCSRHLAINGRGGAGPAAGRVRGGVSCCNRPQGSRRRHDRTYFGHVHGVGGHGLSKGACTLDRFGWAR